MNVWITKDCLHLGIREGSTTETLRDGDRSYAIVLTDVSTGQYVRAGYISCEYWHRSREDAERAAVIQKQQKITRLYEQLGHLQRMTFKEATNAIKPV